MRFTSTEFAPGRGDPGKGQSTCRPSRRDPEPVKTEAPFPKRPSHEIGGGRSRDETPQSRLDAALSYGRCGWPVLPIHSVEGGRCSCRRRGCWSPGKHPHTEHGLKDATTNEEVIRDWWTEWPDANVGVVTGESSGLVVIDIDPRNGGNEALEELERKHGRLPDTATVQTSGGGRHLYFSTDGPVPSGVLVSGVDFKGDGGYVVAPPSGHASGEVYRGDEAFDDVAPLAELPPWLMIATENRAAGAVAVGGAVVDPFLEGARNDTLTSIAGSLRRRGLGDEVIGAALLAVNGGACQPPLDSVEVRRIATSIAQRPSLDLMVQQLNEQHAVVIEGGRTLVITEDYDPVLERHIVRRSTFPDIQNRYANTRVHTVTPQGKPTTRDLGRAWLNHPNRREYRGVVFAPNQDKPGYYNLWRGYAVEPKAGDWSRLKHHIRDVICRGDDTLIRYVMAWMAHAVQVPGEPAEVALVLRGAQGVGKGIFVRELGGLFGQHFVHVSHPRHLSGNFNAHLQDAVVVFADEAFGVGDKQSVAVVKMLITERMIPIERKHHDAEMAKNVVHLIMASNDDWVVPAGLDERRFCVLDVSLAHQGDHDYFGEMVEQMERGGRDAMLYELLHHDYSDINLREPPATDALMEQKLLSLAPHEQWWFEKLTDGRLLNLDSEWRTQVDRQKLTADYADFVGRKDRGTATQLGIRLKSLLPAGFPKTGQRMVEQTPNGVQLRRRCWILPSLEECRVHWDERTRTKNVWVEERGPDDAHPSEPVELKV